VAKGEKGIASVVGLVCGHHGPGDTILPIVFTWIGKTLSAIAINVLVIAFLLYSVIIKGFKVSPQLA
jgi:hypothetical protein